MTHDAFIDSLEGIDDGEPDRSTVEQALKGRATEEKKRKAEHVRITSLTSPDKSPKSKRTRDDDDVEVIVDPAAHRAEAIKELGWTEERYDTTAKYQSMSVNAIKDLLRWNQQPLTGNKAEVIARVVDCELTTPIKSNITLSSVILIILMLKSDMMSFLCPEEECGDTKPRAGVCSS